MTHCGTAKTKSIYDSTSLPLVTQQGHCRKSQQTYQRDKFNMAPGFEHLADEDRYDEEEAEDDEEEIDFSGATIFAQPSCAS